MTGLGFGATRGGGVISPMEPIVPPTADEVSRAILREVDEQLKDPELKNPELTDLQRASLLRVREQFLHLGKKPS